MAEDILSRTKTFEAFHGEVYLGDGHVRVKQRHTTEEQPANCWAKCKHAFRGVWATKYSENIEPEERVKLMRVTIRELIVYMIFICVLAISWLTYNYITFGMRSVNMYNFSLAMRTALLDTGIHDGRPFSELYMMDDFWHYMEGPFLDVVYNEEWYGERKNETDFGWLLNENKLLGLPRLRTIKMKNDSCKPPPAFEREIRECFANYFADGEYTYPYGPAYKAKRDPDLKHQEDNTAAFVHHTNMDTAIGYTASIQAFPNNGYYQELSRHRAKAEEQLANLKAGRWVDRGTRVVFLDFTVYNANANLFCVIKLVFEFPASGGIITMADFKTVKLLRYNTPFDYFVLVCEGIFFLFVVYYIVEEVLEIKRWRCSYFKSPWNCLDVLVLILQVCLAGFTVYRHLAVTSKLDSLLKNPDTYANMEFIVKAEDLCTQVLGVMVFWSWVKIFKYVSFNATMNQLTVTLTRCANDVGGFAIFFFIFFFAFAQLGYLLFGTQVREFSSFYEANLALLRTLLGDFEFRDLNRANSFLGPIYFSAYVFLVFFVLLNVFLAIVAEAYAEVKSELAEAESDLDMSYLFNAAYDKLLRRYKLKKEELEDLNEIFHGEEDEEGERVFEPMPYEEWKAAMLERGYSRLMIEKTFSRFDVDEDGVLDETEQKMMENELKGQKAEMEQELDMEEKAKNIFADERTTGQELNVLHRRIDRAEFSLGGVCERIDTALRTLERLDRKRAAHRERMVQHMRDIAATHGSVATPDQVRPELDSLQLEAADLDLESSSQQAFHSGHY